MRGKILIRCGAAVLMLALALALALAVVVPAAAQAQPATEAGGPAAGPASLKVCVAEDNAPLSYDVREGSLKQAPARLQGLDVALAGRLAAALGRPLSLLPFESTYEKESTLSGEVNALLSAGLCDLVSGFPLIAADLAPPRPGQQAKPPDYPGAKRRRDRAFVPLQPLAASRPYQAVALGVVMPLGAAPVQRLADLAGRRVGAVAGTLTGTVLVGYRQGLLRPSLVSLGQRDDVFARLQTGSLDAALVPLEQFDAWRLKAAAAHVAEGQAASAPAGLELAAWRGALGIQLGFVARASDAALLADLDRHLAQLLASGDLARLAQEQGVSWQPPGPGSSPASRGLEWRHLLED